MKKYKIDSKLYKYPKAYNKIIDLNLVDFDIWYLMEEEQATRRYYDLQERFRNRMLIPFARRDDNDDIACFEVGKGEKVEIIHDFTTEGFEQRREFADLWEWIESVIAEMIERNRENEDKVF